MSSAAASEHHLSSLSLDTPPSSSPFPSPSSSFLPPPMPGAHEFAVKPPPAASRKSVPSINATSEKEEEKSHSTLGDENKSPKTPTASIVLPPPESFQESVVTTPTPATTAAFSSQIANDNNVNNPSSPKTPVFSNTSFSSTLQPTPSSTLTYTRPAPPSPVASRRTSRAISSTSNSPSVPHHSPRSSKSHIGKRISTQSSSNRKSGHLSQLSNSSPLCLPTSHDDEDDGDRMPIKIVDFAFPPKDDRRAGLGEHTPKSNRLARLIKRLTFDPSAVSGDETESDDDDGNLDEDEEGGGGSGGGFSWGRLSWSFTQRANGQDGAGEPSKTDLDRNFGSSSSAHSSSGEEGYHDAEDYEGEEDGDDEELPPGLYRALYAFEPEGTAEMRLVEDQIVRIIGRGGGGAGWAIAVADDDDGSGGRHALVPEGYLELVELT